MSEMSQDRECPLCGGKVSFGSVLCSKKGNLGNIKCTNCGTTFRCYEHIWNGPRHTDDRIQFPNGISVGEKE